MAVQPALWMRWKGERVAHPDRRASPAPAPTAANSSQLPRQFLAPPPRPRPSRSGRKRAALTYCVTYTLGCLTKHFNSFWVLAGGRVLCGIATSLLFSAFESWLVSEHFKRGFHADWLGSTFSSAVFLGNGLMAILSGALTGARGRVWCRAHGRRSQRCGRAPLPRRAALEPTTCLPVRHARTPRARPHACSPLARPHTPPASPGLLANVLVENLDLGPVSPFDAAATVLTVGGCVIAATWPENYGSGAAPAEGGPGEAASTADGFKKAAALIWSEPKIALLGAMQSLFEASMYTFVFLWTPALRCVGFWGCCC